MNLVRPANLASSASAPRLAGSIPWAHSVLGVTSVSSRSPGVTGSPHCWHHVQGNQRHKPQSQQHKISAFHAALLDPFHNELENTVRKLSICFFSFFHQLQPHSCYHQKTFHLFFLLFSPVTTPLLLPSAHTYRPESLLGSASTDNKCQHHKPQANKPLTFYPQDPLLLHGTLAINVP